MATKTKATAAATIIDAPKASEILTILGEAKGYLVNETILAKNAKRLASKKTKVRLSSPDITAYIGSPTRYQVWDGLIESLPKLQGEELETAKRRLGGFRSISLLGRGLVVADKGGVNAKGARVYRFSLTQFKD